MYGFSKPGKSFKKEMYMRVKNALAAFLVLACIGMSGSAMAVSSYVTAFDKAYPAAKNSDLSSCLLCHTNQNNPGPRNSYGADFAGSTFASIESIDSDGDGATNIEEIQALTFPGNAQDAPGTVLPPEPFPAQADLFTNADNWRTVSGVWTLDSSISTSLGSSSFLPSKANSIAAFGGNAPNASFVPFTAGQISSQIRLSGKGAKAAIIFGFVNKKQYRYVRIEGKKVVVGQIGKIGAVKAGVKTSIKLTTPVPLDLFHSVLIDIASTGDVTITSPTILTEPLIASFGSGAAGEVGIMGSKIAHFDEFLVTPQ